MIRFLLAAFRPTPEQIANGQFFLGLWLGTALGMNLVGYLIPEYGIAIYTHWRARRRLARRRRAAVIDFAERRRLLAVLALPEGPVSAACSWASCQDCGGCTAPWERDAEHEPFTCIRCGVECELDNHEPFCSLNCRNNYDGPPDGDAWSGGFAENH